MPALRRTVRGLLVTLAILVTTDALAVELQPVLQGLSRPLYVTHAREGSGRLFIVEQAGRIKVLPPGAAVPTVFLDITDRVLDDGERGLLGLAFHPDYATNGFFYVHYTDSTGDVIVARYLVSANPDVANPGSEVILKTIPHSQFANHNGGMVEFGPDRHLYVGVGDGGSSNDPDNNAQRLGTLLGKVLRLDVDSPAPYIPPDNPFGNEIWAYGLRNPFRFSFDRGTGQLFAGDVGQGAREEIDVITRGGNYGWRVFEGSLCTGLGPAPCGPQFIPPIAEYSHAGDRCSVIGGYVYRGSAGTLPVGTYVFGDFCTGELFMLQNGAVQVLLDTGLSISSFGEDAAGELYVVGLGGTIHRLVADPGAFAGGVFIAAGDLPGSGTILTGPGPGTSSQVRLFRPDGSPEVTNLLAFGPFMGGARVAVGDVNHDGVVDLVLGAGPGGGPHVRVLSGADPTVELASFFAFDPAFTGGVFVAAGDVNADGFADLIVGPGAGGGPHVRVFSGAALPALIELASFFAYAPTFTGGARVAVGDVNGDGFADIVTGAGPGGGPHVQVFSGANLSLLRSFFAFDPAFTGGVFVAAGDLTGDGRADLVVGADAGGGPHVRAFDGVTQADLANFFAYVPGFTGGVRVAIGDVNGDGFADIVTGPGLGGGPHVRAFTAGGAALPTSFMAY
jgi:glucose/arabinose dehydrogenase